MTMAFAPSILVNGETVTPTGDEWILAFALRGCQWAIDAIKEKVMAHKALEDLKDQYVAE